LDDGFAPRVTARDSSDAAAPFFIIGTRRRKSRPTGQVNKQGREPVITLLRLANLWTSDRNTYKSYDEVAPPHVAPINLVTIVA
jgi:hypothetical protein